MLMPFSVEALKSRATTKLIMMAPGSTSFELIASYAYLGRKLRWTDATLVHISVCRVCTQCSWLPIAPPRTARPRKKFQARHYFNRIHSKHALGLESESRHVSYPCSKDAAPLKSENWWESSASRQFECGTYCCHSARNFLYRKRESFAFANNDHRIRRLTVRRRRSVP